MKLGKIIGTIVATRKYENLEGLKLLVLQPLDDRLKNDGDPLVAVDTVQAGPKTLVYWIMGREASLALENTFVPVDASIVGIVDSIDSEGQPRIS